MVEIRGEGILGKKVQGTRRTLDTFDLPPETVHVTYESDEVTSLCPITGQPDWYKVTITISGSRLGIESKSLKLYLQSWREEGQFCEEFSATIAKDVRDATKAQQVAVTTEQKPRGGVSIKSTSVTAQATSRDPTL